MRWNSSFVSMLACSAALIAGLSAMAAPEPGPVPEPPAAEWVGVVQQQVRDTEYNVSWQSAPLIPGLDAAWHAPNRAHDLRTYFTPEGIRITERQATRPRWSWGVSLVAVGRGEHGVAVAPASLTAAENRIEYSRGAITEWYVNDRLGLEQGFDLAAPPEELGLDPTPDTDPRSKAPLFLELELHGDLIPRLSEDRQSVVFATAAGERVLRYAKLVVRDAADSPLVAWIELFGQDGRRGIRLRIDDRGAAYPIVVDPLTSSPVWTAEGAKALDKFGSVLATAGDVNGDGYSDVIVGAQFFDNGQVDEGKVFVYLGSSAGLALTPVWTHELDVAQIQYGSSVSNAGDVNGDGYSDVLVGARLQGGSQFHEGRVWAHHGGPSGPSTSFNWSVDSDQVEAQLGFSVASAGDVNGDGYADVIIAAPYFDNVEIDEGRAWVHLGSASGLSNFANWTAESDQGGAAFGWSVGTAGDVNGDGYSDVIVGAPLYRDTHFEQGSAFVYHGSALGLSAAADARVDVDQISAWCGWSISTAGDVDGDGFSDVLMGCPLYDDAGNHEGGAFLFRGSLAGISATPDWSAIGPSNDDDLGRSVATAGDVNGDGYADVIIGAPGAENGQTSEGMAFAYAGSAGGLSTTPFWSTEGNQAFGNYGGAVATAGDVDGDGYADVLVGDSLYDNGLQDTGKAYLFHGSPRGPDTSSLWQAESDQNDALLSYSVSTAGDVDGDTFSDVIIGAPYFDNGLPDEGRVLVYHGGTMGVEPSPTFTIDGGQANGLLGWSVAAAGDVDGDGFGDVLIGGPGFQNGESGEGFAFVFFGSGTGLEFSPFWRGEIDVADAELGTSVAPAGDVDGDGFADVIVGAPGYTNGESGEGAAFIFLGSFSGPESPPAWSVEGDQVDASLGAAVASAGDVQLDGYSDVVVGAPLYDGAFVDQGRVLAYRGTPFGVIGQPFWTADGPHASSEFGAAVGSAGDVNGDGHAEVIVGAPSFSDGPAGEGAAYLYEGSSGGLTVGAVWTVEGDASGAEMGRSVGCAGDVNGDGFADVIVGAPRYSNGQSEEGQARAYPGSAVGLSIQPIWVAESNQVDARLGWSVGSAGDLNADGFADLIVGVPWSDNIEDNEGRAEVFFGNGLGGYLLPQQRQPDDSKPIGPEGRSDTNDEFLLIAFARSAFGQGLFKLEWEAKAISAAFDGVADGQSPNWVQSVLPTTPPIAGFHEVASGMTPGAAYHWRARLLYHPATSPFQQASRWFSVPLNGWAETDLRLPANVEVGVTQIDSKDPVYVAESYSYSVDLTNTGPDGIDVAIEDTLAPDVSFISAVPTQGECFEADHQVTCMLGRLDPAGTASAVVTVLPTSPGVQINTSRVGLPAGIDSDLLNNMDTIDTTVVTPSIGNRVWDDTDGDGIQDIGEPGLQGALIALFDASDNLLDTVVSGVDGSYALPSLVFTSNYYVRFFPPSGFVITAPDVGGDDEIDSDADPFTFSTPIFSLIEQSDQVRWDAGMHPSCVVPDEPVFIGSMGVTDDGNDFAILNYLDPNQPSQITGYNVYRSSDPAPPPSSWPLVASDVIDMDEATPNKQWIDTSGDVSPSGVWYYEITGYNNRCPAEGPF